MPLMIIVTDGAGNVAITDMPPQEEALRIAAMVHKADLRTVVINTEHEAFDRGLAQGLADTLGGPWLHPQATQSRGSLPDRSQSNEGKLVFQPQRPRREKTVPCVLCVLCGDPVLQAE